ncbi:MAG TPA: methyltransferase domain-containing protein [Dyella sp.]|nr:methyltransferase domain-containing protein [Dyella sp.]
MSESQAIDWEARYQAGRTGWERPGLHPALIAWRASGELIPCCILIPGAGRSPEPLALADAGFAVTVLDVAPSAAAAQRQRLGSRGAVVQSDLFAWEPPMPFDAVYDQTCLCALPPERVAEYEQCLARWLRADGSLFVLFMQTSQPGGPPFDCPIAEMRKLFAAERWVWPDALPPLIAHPSLRDEQPVRLRRR